MDGEAKYEEMMKKTRIIEDRHQGEERESNKDGEEKRVRMKNWSTKMTE